MSTQNTSRIPSFRAIRNAILQAPPRSAGFPLETLHDPNRLQRLRIASHLSQFLADLRAETERARSTPIAPLPFGLFHVFEANGDRLTYEAPYFASILQPRFTPHVSIEYNRTTRSSSTPLYRPHSTSLLRVFLNLRGFLNSVLQMPL